MWHKFVALGFPLCTQALATATPLLSPCLSLFLQSLQTQLSICEIYGMGSFFNSSIHKARDIDLILATQDRMEAIAFGGDTYIPGVGTHTRFLNQTDPTQSLDLTLVAPNCPNHPFQLFDTTANAYLTIISLSPDHRSFSTSGRVSLIFELTPSELDNLNQWLFRHHYAFHPHTELTQRCSFRIAREKVDHQIWPLSRGMRVEICSQFLHEIDSEMSPENLAIHWNGVLRKLYPELTDGFSSKIWEVLTYLISLSFTDPEQATRERIDKLTMIFGVLGLSTLPDVLSGQSPPSIPDLRNTDLFVISNLSTDHLTLEDPPLNWLIETLIHNNPLLIEGAQAGDHTRYEPSTLALGELVIFLVTDQPDRILPYLLEHNRHLSTQEFDYIQRISHLFSRPQTWVDDLLRFSSPEGLDRFIEDKDPRVAPFYLEGCLRLSLFDTWAPVIGAIKTRNNAVAAQWLLTHVSHELSLDERATLHTVRVALTQAPSNQALLRYLYGDDDSD